MTARVTASFHFFFKYKIHVELTTKMWLSDTRYALMLFTFAQLNEEF